MPLMRGSIPALFGGVSQQSTVLRAPNQVEAATNCRFTVADGATKRPGLMLRHTAGFSDSHLWAHWIVREGERYLVTFSQPKSGDAGWALRVYDGEGNQVPTEHDSLAAEYLTQGMRPDLNLTAVTEGNSTVIVNRTVKARMLPELTTDHSFLTTNTLADIETPQVNQHYRVRGEQQNSFGQYWVQYKSGDFFDETVAPGVPYRFDRGTMPVRLLLQEDDNPLGVKFYLEVIEWSDRLVGDEDSNPEPSFIGQTIARAFFYRGRLGFLAGEAMVMSETDDAFNFWRKTATDVLDTSRIDVTAALGEYDRLTHVQTMGDALIIMSEKRQFQVTSQPSLSPKTISIQPTTAYQTDSRAGPVAAGPSMFFAVPSGRSTQIREMYVHPDSITNVASNITSHVPSYIPGDVKRLEANTSQDMLFVAVEEEDRDALYVYQWYVSGEEQAQAAWNKWEFPAGVRVAGMKQVGSRLELVLDAFSIGTGWGLFEFDLEPTKRSAYFPHPVCLDFQNETVGVYDALNGTTRFSLAWHAGALNDSRSDWQLIVVDDPTDTYQRGQTLDVPGSTFSGLYFYIPGDFEGMTVIAGRKFTQSLTFTELQVKEESGTALSARVNIRNMLVAYKDTGYFRVNINYVGRDPAVSDYFSNASRELSARTTGMEWFQLSVPQIHSGIHSFPVMSRASDCSITLENDSYVPATWVRAEWEALVTTRIRR